jgi:hypothetical protein
MEYLRPRNTFVTKLSTFGQVPVNTHGSGSNKNNFLFWEFVSVDTTKNPRLDHHHATKIIHSCDVSSSFNWLIHDFGIEEVAVFPIDVSFISPANPPRSSLVHLQFLHFDCRWTDEEKTMVSAGETFGESRV